MCSEGGELPEGGMTIGAELALADHVSGLDNCDGCCGGMEGIEAQHGSGDPFDQAVALLKDIVEVFQLPDLNRASVTSELGDDAHRLRTSQVGPAFVD